MRTSVQHSVNDAGQFKKQLLCWAQQFREVVFLDSNDYKQQYSSYDAILAVDALTSIVTDYYNAFEDLDVYQKNTKDWLFGYLSYDLKNDIEALSSDNYDGLDFPDLFFFQPKKLFLLKGNIVEIAYLTMCEDEVDADLKEISECIYSANKEDKSISVLPRISKEKYLEKTSQMLNHISKGDIYEANLCMEFYVENAAIDPYTIYSKLNAISQPPFAAYLKYGHHYILSASPERYLRKEGSKIISQPIKGTVKRSTDPADDELLKQGLSDNEKERSENIMIVDLVRNDLSRTATQGSVQVEELCGAYTFSQVHHLISTVVSTSDSRFSPIDIIKQTYPMGSMTGAPKISAMKIIENLEETKRGVYSGAAGYFTPTGDFDFNVLIRTIFYSQANKYVSFSVGSAITAQANAEDEYNECLLKANAMRRVLSGNE